jgi:hypothetical protein
VVERWWWWREEEASVEAVAEETDSSCVDGGRVESDTYLESGGDLESFGMKSEMTRCELLFIDLKISTTILN